MNSRRRGRCGPRTGLARHREQQRRLDRLAAEDAASFAVLLAQMEDRQLALLLALRHARRLSWPALWEEAQESGLVYCERQLYRLYLQALDRAAALTEAGDGV